MKDAVCMTADCIRARAHDAGSFLPNLRQGIGYGYNGRTEITSNIAGSVKQTVNHVAEDLEEIGENYYDEFRDMTRNAYRIGKDRGGECYDFVRDRAGEYSYDRPQDWSPRNYFSAMR